jgi:S-adenosylmethionine hydrolase
VARVVTFLTDYGYEDEFVGVCHGVVARLAPEVRVIDLTHGVARHDVRSGALILRRALPFFPPGVHLGVVDPGVGGDRRAIAARTAEEERLLVGPDNGLLSLAAARFGGVVEAVDVSRSPHRLEPVSATFHGRDTFAPVAAHLALGEPLVEAGEPLDPEALVGLELPRARAEGDDVVCHALAFDRFGNVMLGVEHEELTAMGLKLGDGVLVNGDEARYTTTFADVPPGALLLYEDAYRALSLAVNRGSAADRLGLDLDGEVRIAAAGR